MTSDLLSVALSWLLGLITAIAQQQSVPAEVAWEREGLAGREVRALAMAPDSGVMAALVGASRDNSPLWRRETQGWTPVGQSPTGLLLALAPMPDGGFLLGVGRDLADQPGVYWVNGGTSPPRRLYDGQAVGALATLVGRGGTEILAAIAPWADRDGADLLRRDPSSGAWSVILHGNLACGTGPSYFRQLVALNGDPGTLIALEWCYAATVRQSQLWRTDDHGQTWQVLGHHGSGYPLIGAVAADPTDPSVLYLAERSPGTDNGGLQRSLDGGQTWELRGDDLPALAEVRAILVDRRDPRRVFAGTDHGGVLLSEDRGDSWRSLPGLEGPRVWSLFIDERDARLYAATGDGIWRMSLP